MRLTIDELRQSYELMQGRMEFLEYQARAMQDTNIQLITAFTELQRRSATGSVVHAGLPDAGLGHQLSGGTGGPFNYGFSLQDFHVANMSSGADNAFYLGTHCYMQHICM